MKNDYLRCEYCGKFIGVNSLDNGARCVMVSPDSEYTYEDFEILCKKCNTGEEPRRAITSKF